MWLIGKWKLDYMQLSPNGPRFQVCELVSFTHVKISWDCDGLWTWYVSVWSSWCFMECPLPCWIALRACKGFKFQKTMEETSKFQMNTSLCIRTGKSDENIMKTIYIGTSKDILVYLHGLPPEWPSTQSLSTFISDLRSSKIGLLKKHKHLWL